jgi:hypothetical protein
MLSNIQKEALKKPCPHCEKGQLHEVETNDSEKEYSQYNVLWCNNCDLSMDDSGGYIA